MQILQTRPLATQVNTQRRGSRTSADLKPKEHGAYAILAIPLITALVVGGVTVAGACVVLAACAGFFSHELLLVLWGHRGRRAMYGTPGAKSRLATLLGIIAISGCVAFVFAPPPCRVALMGCLLAAGVSFSIALTGKHRTLAAQLWGVAGLSLPCVPILLAGGVGTWPALAFWLTWLIGFSCTTAAVRGVIASQKGQPRDVMWTVLIVPSLLVVLNALGPLDLALATIPMIAMSWYLMLRPPSPTHLKRVGWSLVAGTVVTAILITVLSAGR